jgi:hypothetical protein
MKSAIAIESCEDDAAPNARAIGGCELGGSGGVPPESGMPPGPDSESRDAEARFV